MSVSLKQADTASRIVPTGQYGSLPKVEEYK